MYLFDTLSLERALDLPLDHELRRLLRQRVNHLTDESVRDCTYFLVVDADSTLDDVVDELGWSPVHDLAGERYGTPAFAPFHDYIEDHGRWFELLIGAGNEAVFALLVEDDGEAESELIAFCREYVSH